MSPPHGDPEPPGRRVHVGGAGRVRVDGAGGGRVRVDGAGGRRLRVGGVEGGRVRVGGAGDRRVRVDGVEGGRVRVGGVEVDALTEGEVVRRVAAAMEAGEGGRIVTPNVDICRAAASDPALRELVCSADLVVADGMPLVWAARLLGTPLPARVTGADLLWSLTELAARHDWPVYLLGGGPPHVAPKAARELTNRHPRLRVCGAHAPPFHFDATPEGAAEVRGKVIAARPRLVFAGLGFPRQDLLIAALREELPETWFLGCGAAIAFAAGTLGRAPAWMRRTGLEWAFRLGAEPVRLAPRYLVNDLPYAARLLGGSFMSASVRGRGRPPEG
ncbi:WecB/TagA/CpsF family glycosyltransferase [Nonomuraea sp. NPDC050404]|uniref:WecB/TagA/CpsF family glycosyltransferase n=1 Tax=Nonomuraea sp. NPDC050404 TaxID=3155783 RepID=UPI00340A4583